MEQQRWMDTYMPRRRVAKILQGEKFLKAKLHKEWTMAVNGSCSNTET